jgi:hypothetical protein
MTIKKKQQLLIKTILFIGKGGILRTVMTGENRSLDRKRDDAV